MTLTARKPLILIALFAFSPVLQALPSGLIDYGGFITDTNTGLDWIHPGLSTNCSYDDVAAKTGCGAAFEGWGHASSTQVEDFVGHWLAPVAELSDISELDSGGVKVTYDDNEILNSGIMSDLLMTRNELTPLPGSSTLSGIEFSEIYGSTSDGYSEGYLAVYGIQNQRLIPKDGSEANNKGRTFIADFGAASEPSETLGHWLVRETVDEPDVPIAAPASLPLFALGLLFLGLRRKTG